MLAKMSINAKVRFSGLVVSVLAVATALISWTGIRSLDSALEDVVRNATLLANHQNADMMHDALRADVLAALYSASQGATTKSEAVRETKEHAEKFRQMVSENKKIAVDGEIAGKLKEVEVLSERYISTAEDIVAQSAVDASGAAAKFGGFMSQFSTLEEAMGETRHLVENQNKAVQSAGSRLANDTLGHVTVMSALALIVIAILAAVVPKSVTEKLKRIQSLGVTVAAAAAQGNLAIRADDSTDDEVGNLARQLNEVLSGFQKSISEIRGAVASLVRITGEVAQFSSETNEGVQRQHSETELVATAVNEMTATVQEIARNSMHTATSANDGNDAATSGRRIVAQAIESMDVLSQQVDRAVGVLQKLKTDSDKIGVVLDVIRSIAEQTNLLALNAAIEAARAGEQGRGFAVVADEVRTLAQRTQQSTREIQDMIQRLQSGVGEVASTMEQGQQQTKATVQKVSEAGTSLDAITNAVGAINDMSTQIATTTEEQSRTTEEINRNVATISSVADRVAATAERAARSTQEMSELTRQLDRLVQRFKLG